MSSGTKRKTVVCACDTAQSSHKSRCAGVHRVCNVELNAGPHAVGHERRATPFKKCWSGQSCTFRRSKLFILLHCTYTRHVLG
jgi:hypothetical protein